MKTKNKGFAITALLYGLSIMALMTVVLMMSIMQNTRKNNTTTVKGVEQELNSYGQASADFSGSGNTKYVVPTGQEGYYKIELFNGGSNGTMASGTIYLKENDVINMNISTNSSGTSTITKDGVDIMRAGTGNDVYVNGMARFANISGNYHFINGQVFTGLPNEGKGVARINKVSSAENIPAKAHDYFDSVGCIEVSSNITLSAVSYNDKNGSIHRYTGTGKVTMSGNLSEINVKATSDITNPTINIYSSSCSGTPKYTIKTASEGYKFKSGTEVTISRYSPVDRTIRIGNYAISRLTSDDDHKHTTIHSNTLSTSAHTPTANPRTTSNPNLITYGTSSIGRPVIISRYKGSNSQKWRIDQSVDAGGIKRYRVSEIEEYKPFALNTGSQDTATGEGGPTLICGVYLWDDNKNPKFQPFDNEMNSVTENKQWEFVPAGLGLYTLKSNHVSNSSNRTLSCNNKNDSNTRCYVTSKPEEATLFEVFNVNY